VAKLLHRIGWIGLTVVGAFLLFAVAADLAADHRDGVPADHAGAFTALAGHSFTQVKQATPGVARYVTTLEAGYALHELTFAVLFLALVLIPLRRGQRWAWWTCWAIMIASVGYTLTIARHDTAILGRSLIADIVVPLLLAAAAPAMFARPAEAIIN
jgi:hypothetical protein